MATLGRAALGIFSALTLSGDTPQENKEQITVFRGTTFTDEHQVHDETGLLMSEAARRAYNEEMYISGDTGKAILAASRENLVCHSELLRKYGGETALAVAQSDGSFTSKEYPRSMFSVTTNESVARRFANGPGGKVYSATIPKGMLVRQTLSSSNESEYFVRGMWKFEELK